MTRRPCTTSRRRGAYRVGSAGGPIERPAQQVAEEFARAATRAKSMVRRLIQAGGLDHLLTLTYRENRTDARQCHADLTRFLRLVRNALPDDYKYVAVFERQKRGAGDWHLAVAGWQQVRLLRELWRQVVGDGNIDVRSWGSCPADRHPTQNGFIRYISRCCCYPRLRPHFRADLHHAERNLIRGPLARLPRTNSQHRRRHRPERQRDRVPPPEIPSGHQILHSARTRQADPHLLPWHQVSCHYGG